MSSFDDGTSKCKGVSAEHQAGLGVCRATQHFDDGTSKCKICGVLAENVAFDGGHQKKSLHPSRRMARKNLRHGEAVFFLSGCRSQTPYSKKASEYKKILQISEIIQFLFCYYKIKLYLCSLIKDPFCPFGHLPLYGKNWQSADARNGLKIPKRA